MKELIVNKKYDGKKLNKFLMDSFPNLKSGNIFKALRKKDIKINGKRISDNVILATNDKISLFISDELLDGSKSTFSLDIVYDDDNIVLINKPAGIEVTGENSLTTMACKFFNFAVYPCHRLDRNTSGLVIFAKNIEARDILFDKFKNREIEKYYITEVFGIVKKDFETLEDYLFKDSKKAKVYISNSFKKGYQKIITIYKVLNRNYDNNTSLLEVQIKTGRTHQIRAHLSFIGHPIIGDGKYGINEINRKFHCKYQKLCSYKIKFNFKTDSGILNYLNGKDFGTSPKSSLSNP